MRNTTTTNDSEPSLTEIELIERHDEPESQCGRCGYKYTRLWNLGEHEDEELAACGDCTVEVINTFEKYTLFEKND